jgi:hypothetical protein
LRASVEIAGPEKIAMARKVKKAKKQVKKSSSGSRRKKVTSKKKSASKSVLKKKAGSRKKAALKPRRATARAAALAANEVILVAPDVPENLVDVTIEGFMNAGATKVEKQRKNNGNFRLTAIFPD